MNFDFVWSLALGDNLTGSSYQWGSGIYQIKGNASAGDGRCCPGGIFKQQKCLEMMVKCTRCADMDGESRLNSVVSFVTMHVRFYVYKSARATSGQVCEHLMAG